MKEENEGGTTVVVMPPQAYRDGGRLAQEIILSARAECSELAFS